jgi:transcriptional regulator GlxA family with amidase domain
MTAIKLDASEEDRINIRMKVMLNQDQRYIIRSLMESLLRESASACPPELSSAASLIAAVLCILSQGYFMDEQRSETYRMIDHYSQSLEACVEFIDTHFSQPLTLEYLAAKYAFSKSTFSLLFPQYVGMTLKQYINKKRIEHAAVLVRNTELTLTEVAAMTGYEEFSTFYRNFKRMIGVSPSDYRAAAAEN